MERQFIHRVITLHRKQGVVIDSFLIAWFSVPHEGIFVAYLFFFKEQIGRVYIELQMHNRVALGSGFAVVHIRSGHIQIASVERIGFFVGDMYRIVNLVSRHDAHDDLKDGVTAVDRRNSVVELTFLIIRFAAVVERTGSFADVDDTFFVVCG